MSIDVGTGTTITFDKFWRWLREHSNCILRAGTDEVWLFDHEELHWHLEEDARHNPVVQLLQGKKLMSEMVLEVRDILFVQATPEQEAGPQATLFELVVGTRDETFSAYHFLIAHPFEEEAKAHTSGLKH